MSPTRSGSTLRRKSLTGYVGTADEPIRHWVINGDFFGLGPTSLARYAVETTLALDMLVATDHPLTRGLSLSIVSPRPTSLKLRAIPVRVVPEFDRPRLPQFWVQAQLPRHVAGGLLSFCNLAPVRVRRQIVCMHDSHAWFGPGSGGGLLRWLYRSTLRALGRRAAHVTTVSEFSRSELITSGVATADRTTVTLSGSDHIDRWNAEKLLLARGHRPYVVAVGGDQPDKDLDLPLRLAPMLDMIGVDLWIAGELGARSNEVSSVPTHGAIRWLDRVGDNALKGIFAGALGFLCPGRVDAFGLRGIEAMASECPVIASGAPGLFDVFGDAALYAGLDDPGAWVRHVARLKCDPQFRATRVETGLRQAGEYTWRRVAEIYLELMSRVDRVGQAA